MTRDISMVGVYAYISTFNLRLLSFINMILFSGNYESAPEDIKEFSTALNIVKTIIPMNNPLNEASIISGLKKANKAGFNHELLEDQVNIMLDELVI